VERAFGSAKYHGLFTVTPEWSWFIL